MKWTIILTSVTRVKTALESRYHNLPHVPLFNIFKKYFLLGNKESTSGFSVSSGGTTAVRPSMGLAMSCAAVLIVFYVSLNNDSLIV